MSIKKNLDNNLSAFILYRAIDNKPCFYPPFKETLLAAYIRNFALTHVDYPCRCMNAMAQ